MFVATIFVESASSKVPKCTSLNTGIMLVNRRSELRICTGEKYEAVRTG